MDVSQKMGCSNQQILYLKKSLGFCGKVLVSSVTSSKQLQFKLEMDQKHNVPNNIMEVLLFGTLMLQSMVKWLY